MLRIPLPLGLAYFYDFMALFFLRGRRGFLFWANKKLLWGAGELVLSGHVVGFAVYFGCVILEGLQIVGLRRGNLLRRGLLRCVWLLTWQRGFLY